jgi:hypothetical protein
VHPLVARRERREESELRSDRQAGGLSYWDTLRASQGSLAGNVAAAGGYRVFAGRIPAASDLAGIYEDVGAVLITLSTSSVPSFRFSTSVSNGPAMNAIRSSIGDYPFERKIFPPVSST